MGKIKILFLSLFSCFSFSGCDSDPFPIKYVYMVDVKLKTCDQFVVSDIDKVKFRFDKSIPFEDCPTSFGFKSEETGKFMSWIRRQKKQIEGE